MTWILQVEHILWGYLIHKNKIPYLKLRESQILREPKIDKNENQSYVYKVMTCETQKLIFNELVYYTKLWI